MRYLANYTGGSMIMADSFASNLFFQSFQVFLQKDLLGHFKMGFAGQLEVKVCSCGDYFEEPGGRRSEP